MKAQNFHCVVLGAGAAGMMCAIHAGPGTLLVDHARAPGEKIRISGGGRCNFTNLNTTAGNFISDNPHFAKSALARYTPNDFLALVARHRIAWHEKSLGQLFCDGSSREIIAMLTAELASAGAQLRLRVTAEQIEKAMPGFRLTLSDGTVVQTRHLVIATGGKSIPKMGATGFAYDIAQTFGHKIVPPRPALVPLTFGDRFSPLSGVSLPVRVACNRASFDEAMLFTHRGLSGPAILQISSYWREGHTISVDLLQGKSPEQVLGGLRKQAGGRDIQTMLSRVLPARLAAALCAEWQLAGRLADCSDTHLRDIGDKLGRWQLTPGGSEGYRTAEVTLGGIDTAAISSKTMESRHVGGLYFVGEAVDVTGWLGGYNFQWAWASGHAAGTDIAGRR